MTHVPEAGKQSPLVRLTDVSKHYKNTKALDGIDLELHAGEAVGLLGPNGAGKTTLMRVILGLAKVSGGRATVFGSHPGSSAALARLGATIEGPAFVPALSGRDNLRVIALAKGVPDREIQRCLEIVDLTSAANRKFRTYSMGMKQRLALAQALLGNPEFIVLDEPMNGLDPRGIVEMRKLITELSEEGRTVLISSHQIHEIELVCSRVVVLDAGRVKADAPMSELAGQSLEKAFFNIVDSENPEGL